MKVAVIGLGDIAQKAYLPILTSMPDIELVLCTRDGNTLNQLCAQYRISQSTTDYKQLPDLGVDAVMIHAATSAHSTMAEFFLVKGIATFVDKPLADNLKDVEHLYKLSEQYQTVLYTGFNRRHLPIFEHLGLTQDTWSSVTGIRWEKHRHNLPGELTTFVFDDFIHPLDSINMCAKDDLNDVDVRVQKHQSKIARVDVRWQVAGALYEASMNRLAGQTKEQIQIHQHNRLIELPDFWRAEVFENGMNKSVSLPDWTPTLASKGFTTMINHWLDCVNKQSVPDSHISRTLATHKLAQALVDKIAAQI